MKTTKKKTNGTPKTAKKKPAAEATATKPAAANWLETYKAERKRKEAELYERDELAYDEETADYILDAFRGSLRGRSCLVFGNLAKREQRSIAGLYDEDAYELGQGMAHVTLEAEGRAKAYADGLTEETLAAASEREFWGRVRGEIKLKTAQRENGKPIFKTVDIFEHAVETFGWEELVKRAGLVKYGEPERKNEYGWTVGGYVYVAPEEAARREAAKREAAEAEEREKREREELEAAANVGRYVMRCGAAPVVTPEASGQPEPGPRHVVGKFCKRIVTGYQYGEYVELKTAQGARVCRPPARAKAWPHIAKLVEADTEWVVMPPKWRDDFKSGKQNPGEGEMSLRELGLYIHSRGDRKANVGREYQLRATKRKVERRRN